MAEDLERARVAYLGQAVADELDRAQDAIYEHMAKAYDRYLSVIEFRLRMSMTNVEHDWEPVWCGDKQLCGDPHILYYQCRSCRLEDHGHGGYGRWDPGLTGLWFDDCPAGGEPRNHVPLKYDEFFNPKLTWDR